jgi:hypothetical protein
LLAVIAKGANESELRRTFGGRYARSAIGQTTTRDREELFRARQCSSKPLMADSLQSMRAFLARLDRPRELLTVDAPVDVDFEVAACLAEARDGPGLLFRRRAAAMLASTRRSSATT